LVPESVAALLCITIAIQMPQVNAGNVALSWAKVSLWRNSAVTEPYVASVAKCWYNKVTCTAVVAQ
jgi:hypothetical protein